MFKRVIGEMRETIAEMNRIMGPPKPMVGAGNRPQGSKPSLKPPLQPTQTKPHGMGGTGMAKLGGASKPSMPSHQKAGKPNPVSTGQVTKVMGGTKPTPAQGSSSGSVSKGSSLKMNGMGIGK